MYIYIYIYIRIRTIYSVQCIYINKEVIILTNSTSFDVNQCVVLFESDSSELLCYKGER